MFRTDTTLRERCVNLAIDPAAFSKSRSIADEIDMLQKQLAMVVSEEIQSLRDEGLTQKEEAALYSALRDEFALSGADLVDVLKKNS